MFFLFKHAVLYMIISLALYAAYGDAHDLPILPSSVTPYDTTTGECCPESKKKTDGYIRSHVVSCEWAGIPPPRQTDQQGHHQIYVISEKNQTEGVSVWEYPRADQHQGRCVCMIPVAERFLLQLRRQCLFLFFFQNENNLIFFKCNF